MNHYHWAWLCSIICLCLTPLVGMLADVAIWRVVAALACELGIAFLISAWGEAYERALRNRSDRL